MLHATPPTRNAAATQVADEVMPPFFWTTHRLNQAQLEKVDRVFQQILWLDIIETAMLNEMVNERMSLHMSPKQRRQLTVQMEARNAARRGGTNVSQADAEPEEGTRQVLIDLKLAGFDAAAKIKVIKEVRSILGLGLKEAKETVEGAPVTLQKGLSSFLLKAKLEAAGAQIDLV
jgi:large subunit ribosomal protein L7/L12